MKNFKTLFALLGIAILSFGVVQAQSDPKADKIIKKAQQVFDQAKDLKASFSYTLSAPNMKKPITKAGTVVMKGKNMFKVEFPDQVLITDGKYTWIMFPMDEELTKQDYDEETLSPAKVFTSYKEDMKSRYDGEESGKHKITLFANSKTQDVWKTEMKINKSDNMISEAVMYNRNGTTYKFTLNDIQKNIGVNENMFSVDDAGYEDDGWIMTDLTE